MDMKKVYSAFDLLRFPLILGVVMIHCNFLQFVDGSFDSDGAYVFVEFHAIFKKYVLDLCVPAFFAISGFMFFRDGARMTAGAYVGKLRRRVTTLLVPYMLWNLVGFALFLVKNWPVLNIDSPAGVAGLLGGFICRLPADPFPYDFPLWFIRNLMFIVLLSPFISLLLRALRAAAPLLLFALCVCISWRFPGIDKLGLLPNLLFFTAGAALSCFGCALLSARMMRPMAAIYICVSAACIATDHGALTLAVWFGRALWLLVAMAGIILMFGFACRLAESGRVHMPRSIAGSSFFLYAFHGLFSVVTCKMVMHINPPVGNLACFADYLFIFIILVTVSMSAYSLMLRFTPGLLSLLSGNRITTGPLSTTA